MSVGPVELVVLGFDRPYFYGEFLAELDRLRTNDTVRVLDAVAVYKGADGEIALRSLIQVTTGVGSRIGALVGLSVDAADGLGTAVPLAAAAVDGTTSDEETWDVLAAIPNSSAAALILLEHQWAVPLWDAIVQAGGHRIDDGFLDALDLVEIGLAGVDEAPVGRATANGHGGGMPAPRSPSEQDTDSPV